MDHQKQVCNTFHSSDDTIRRKRGRPRKNPNQIPAKTAYVPENCVLTQDAPPGFEEVNENQPQPVASANSNNMSSMVGKVIPAMIEADFEGGYMISACVGGLGNLLSGVIFKSGKYVPFPSENELAPDIQRIKTDKMPFPDKNEAHLVPGVQKNETNKVTSPANCETHFAPVRTKKRRIPASNGSQSTQLAIMTVQAPTLEPIEGRGTLVPVVLQSDNLLDSVSPAIEARRFATRPAHLTASYVHLSGKPKEMNGAPLSTETRGSGFYPTKMLGSGSSFTQNGGEDLSKPLQTANSDMQSVSGKTGKMTELLRAMERKDFRDPKK